MNGFKSRLVTRIKPDIDRRLRMTAAVRSQTLAAVLDSALDEALPTADQLAELVMSGAQARSPLTSESRKAGAADDDIPG